LDGVLMPAEEGRGDLGCHAPAVMRCLAALDSSAAAR